MPERPFASLYDSTGRPLSSRVRGWFDGRFATKSELSQVASGQSIALSDTTVAGLLSDPLTSSGAAFAGKADEADMQTLLAGKADAATVDTALAGKADMADVDAALAAKADQVGVDTAITNLTTTVSTKADQAAVDSALTTKADQVAVTEALAAKADTVYVDATFTTPTTVGAIFRNTQVEAEAAAALYGVEAFWPVPIVQKITETFTHPDGTNMAGKTSTTGGQVWAAESATGGPLLGAPDSLPTVTSNRFAAELGSLGKGIVTTLPQTTATISADFNCEAPSAQVKMAIAATSGADTLAMVITQAGGLKVFRNASTQLNTDTNVPRAGHMTLSYNAATAAIRVIVSGVTYWVGTVPGLTGMKAGVLVQSGGWVDNVEVILP